MGLTMNEKKQLSGRSVSATIDRALKGKSLTKPGKFLKPLVLIRTFYPLYPPKRPQEKLIFDYRSLTD
jgi:hypothetical protein